MLSHFENILQHFELVNLWFRFFDVMNRLVFTYLLIISPIINLEWRNAKKFSSFFSDWSIIRTFGIAVKSLNCKMKVKVNWSQDEILVTSNLPKSQPNIYQISTLVSLGKTLVNIWLAFWKILRHQKFILRLTDLKYLQSVVTRRCSIIRTFSKNLYVIIFRYIFNKPFCNL